MRENLDKDWVSNLSSETKNSVIVLFPSNMQKIAAYSQESAMNLEHELFISVSYDHQCHAPCGAYAHVVYVHEARLNLALETFSQALRPP